MNEPLVILPGLMADARQFLPQIVALGSTRAITVILPVRGTTVEEMALAALPDLPPRFALVGHSLGGDVALDLVRRIPERVARLALVATDPLSEPPATAAAREARMVAARAGRLMQAMEDEIPDRALAPGEDRAEIRAAIREMAAGLGAEVFLRQSRALQRRPDHQKTLRRAMLPALVMAGEHDTLVPPRRADFAAQLMPFGRLEVIAGAGHLAPLEAPGAVTAALAAFLEGPLLLR